MKWLSIYNNFNMLVMNFMSSSYFPDPELHLLPAYPPTQITTRSIQISNTTEYKSCQKLKKHKATCCRCVAEFSGRLS